MNDSDFVHEGWPDRVLSCCCGSPLACLCVHASCVFWFSALGSRLVVAFDPGISSSELGLKV